MFKKIYIAVGVVAAMSVSAVVNAQILEPISIKDTPADSPYGVIQMVSKQESGSPGYFHQKFIFLHPDCVGGANPVDFYGPSIDPNDEQFLRNELKLCKELPDGGAEESSSD